MSMFNISTRNTAPLPPLVAPGAAPEAPQTVDPSPMPGAVMDQYAGGSPIPLGGEMGALPWESAETPQGPEAAFMNTPGYQELSESEQATLKAFFETAIQGEGAAHADEIAAQLAQLLAPRDPSVGGITVLGALDLMATFNQKPLPAGPDGAAAKGKLAREFLPSLLPPAAAPSAFSAADIAEIVSRGPSKAGRLGARAQDG
ncbi:hypothetical protein J7643_11775 [bacterium]|nr:hypothetical protein [bacterium]